MSSGTFATQRVTRDALAAAVTLRLGLDFPELRIVTSFSNRRDFWQDDRCPDVVAVTPGMESILVRAFLILEAHQVETFDAEGVRYHAQRGCPLTLVAPADHLGQVERLLRHHELGDVGLMSYSVKEASPAHAGSQLDAEAPSSSAKAVDDR